MPPNSLIIGVDLAPIRPIPRTMTFQSDITTDACRATLRAHLKTWRAETVLHDGAPNVGTAWAQDAFSQAELVLQALKLATEFLDEGGTFVTKIFRSKDYNPLLWVFNQLFSNVEATKPPASRNVSAEIFVVCRGFKAPKRLDPKLLDSRSVFAELSEPAPDNEAKVYNPERKNRRRGGYEEGDYTQFKEAYAKDFIQNTDPISILASCNKIVFYQEGGQGLFSEAVSQSPVTTAEIRQCCSDLKVLGRKEFRMLLRWRLQLREKLGLAIRDHSAAAIEDDGTVEIAPLDDELRLQQELQSMNEAQNARRKREKRRENAKKQRGIVRMQMHMLAPHDIGLEQNGPMGEDQLFTASASPLKRSASVGRDHLERHSSAVAAPYLKDACDEEEESESDDGGSEDSGEDHLDAELNLMYVDYRTRRTDLTMKARIKKARQEHDDDWEGISKHDICDSERDCSDSDISGSDNMMDVHNDKNVESEESIVLTKRASLFFDKEDLREIVGNLPGCEHNHVSTADGRTLLTSGPDDHFQFGRQNIDFSPVPAVKNTRKTRCHDSPTTTYTMTSSARPSSLKNLQQALCTTDNSYTTDKLQSEVHISNEPHYNQSPKSHTGGCNRPVARNKSCADGSRY